MAAGPEHLASRVDARAGATGIIVRLRDLTSTLSYNSHGELWKLVYAWPGNGSFQQVLERDSLGRVVKITENGFLSSTQTNTYRYNTAGQLDSVGLNNAKVAGYTYSGNGNRMARRGASGTDTTTATYDAQDRMIRYGKGRYSYTDAGELVKRVMLAGDTLRTTYDALGNLTGAHLKTGDSLLYLVDGANRRVARVLNGKRTATWLYGNALNVAAQEDSTGTVVLRYAYGSQGHVPDLLVKGGVTYRLITDQLGSVRAVVNISSGARAQRTDYDAWGVRTKDSLGTFQPLGYAGGLTDSLTGLIRFGARDYDPGVGRWTSKDPSGTSAHALNTWSYVEQDPLNWIDENGEFRLPVSPRGLPPGWEPDPTHRYPFGERFRNPDAPGKWLDFHEPQPDTPGWRNEPHWHYSDCPKRHLSPGDEVPDPPPFEPVPWWLRLPWEVPFPIWIGPPVPPYPPDLMPHPTKRPPRGA